MINLLAAGRMGAIRAIAAQGSTLKRNDSDSVSRRKSARIRRGPASTCLGESVVSLDRLPEMNPQLRSVLVGQPRDTRANDDREFCCRYG